MEEKINTRKAMVLSVSGWILGFAVALLVQEGDVGQALSSAPVIMLTVMVAATAIAVAAHKRKVNEQSIQ